MIVVGLDCSGDDLLVGLAADRQIVGSRRISAHRRHAELLPGEILTLLSAYGYDLADVEGYAITSGPGSYTGLRVGASVVMGLAAARDLPVAALTSFELMFREYAHPEKPLGCLIPCRGDLYFWCVLAPGAWTTPSMEVCTLPEIAESLNSPMLIVGPRLDEMGRVVEGHKYPPELLIYPAPGAGGRLALWGSRKIADGRLIGGFGWQLNYGPTPGFRRWSKTSK